MEQEGVDFLEAVRLLANRYNIIIPEGNAIDDPNRHEREGVFHALMELIYLTSLVCTVDAK